MSATGRADAIEQRAPSLPGIRHGREREKDDFYATPQWCTNALLRRLEALGALSGIFHVIDPCCGDGAILRAAQERGYNVAGIEIDPARHAKAEEIARRSVSITRGDAFAFEWNDEGEPFAIVTNPPYRDAMRFVEKALAPETGAHVVAMLLRLAWLASAGRAAFHRAHPSDVYVLPKRPSFTGDGTTDSADYAWFVWSAKGGGRWEILNLEGSVAT